MAAMQRAALKTVRLIEDNGGEAIAWCGPDERRRHR
jgi:hypothetical protein